MPIGIQKHGAPKNRYCTYIYIYIVAESVITDCFFVKLGLFYTLSTINHSSWINALFVYESHCKSGPLLHSCTRTTTSFPHCIAIAIFATAGNWALHNTACSSHISLVPQRKTVNLPSICLYTNMQITLQPFRNFSIALQ